MEFRRLYFLTLLWPLSVGIHGQQVSLDTIYVCDSQNTYLVFGSPFDTQQDFVDIGTYYYQKKIEGETVSLRASNASAPFSSIVIKNGDTYYHGIIGYRGNPAKTFYDFRRLESSGQPQALKSSQNQGPINFIGDLQGVNDPMDGEDPLDKLAQETLGGPLVLERLDMIMRRPLEIHTLATLKNRLLIALTNVMVDENATYLKFLFHNKSATRYEIGQVRFQYSDNKYSREMDLKPVATEQVPSINANEQVELGYAIPLAGILEKETMIVTFKDVNGSRQVKLKIPAQALLKTKVF